MTAVKRRRPLSSASTKVEEIQRLAEWRTEAGQGSYLAALMTPTFVEQVQKMIENDVMPDVERTFREAQACSVERLTALEHMNALAERRLSEISTLRSAAEINRRTLDARDGTIQALTNECEQAKRDVAQLTARVEQDDARLSEYRRAEGEWTSKINQLEQQLGQRNELIVELQKQVEMYTGLANAAMEELDARREQWQALVATAAAQFSQIERYRDTLEIVKGLAVKAWIAGGAVQAEALRAALAAHVSEDVSVDSAASAPADVTPDAAADEASS